MCKRLLQRHLGETREMMRGTLFGIALAVMVSAIFVVIGKHSLAPERAAAIGLRQARAEHKTVLIKQIADPEEAELPPKGDLERVKYPSPIGNLTAYISPDRGDGKKRPAIIWNRLNCSMARLMTSWLRWTISRLNRMSIPIAFISVATVRAGRSFCLLPR